MDLLLKNAVIVTVNPDRQIFYHGAMAVDGGRIVAVGDETTVLAAHPTADTVMDLDGKVVFPGFINTHNHLFQTLLKGLGDDSWMCDMSLKLKTQIFDIKRGNGPKYLNFKKLYNVDGTGYIQQLSPVEEAVFNWTDSYIEKWRKEGGVDTDDIKKINAVVEELIRRTPAYQNVPWKYKYGKMTL